MPTLKLISVAKRYGRRTVLDGIDWTFSTGLTLLVGPSGAGKSTLLRVVATAERPTAGAISWEGELLPRIRPSLRAVLGYAPQAVDLPDELTGREFGLHMAALKGLARMPSSEQLTFFAEAVGLGSDLDGRIATFSGGMRRRLVLIQALLGQPRLLALDEPTAELDPVSIGRVVALIRRSAESAVVIMTTHLAGELVEASPTVLQVDEGRIRPL